MENENIKPAVIIFEDGEVRLISSISVAAIQKGISILNNEVANMVLSPAQQEPPAKKQEEDKVLQVMDTNKENK